MKRLIFIFLMIVSFSIFGQIREISINDFNFKIHTEIVDNDWETKDTVSRLYRHVGGKETYLLTFYPYKDGGGDCNNIFWDRESWEIKNDSLIFTTIFYQKTGIDPIPEVRKQIYRVDETGSLILLFDKYRYYNSLVWTDE